MSSEKKFGTLRGVLRVLGLSSDAVDEIVDRIVELLIGEGKESPSKNGALIFPYYLRDHFLSDAELDFHRVLQKVNTGRAVLCTKVALGDVFYVKKADGMSQYRIYTNKIDRKHVDFLLCDPETMRPIVGIELDDKSHQRADRQARDTFVDGVFAAAKLPLLHIPVRRSYVEGDIESQLAPYLSAYTKLPQSDVQMSERPKVSMLQMIQSEGQSISTTPPSNQSIEAKNDTPRCPKCGSEMILRTAKSGANAGNKFWGCSNYPTCRGMTAHQPN